MSDERLHLFDVNALVSLCLSTHQHHRAAHRFLASLDQWCTTPLTEAALYRLLLNPVVTGRQRTFAEIDIVVAGLRTDPRWSFLDDDTTLATPTIDTSVLAGHQQVTDLHLVNLAARHNVVLATFDIALLTWLVPTDRRHVVTIPV